MLMFVVIETGSNRDIHGDHGYDLHPCVGHSNWYQGSAVQRSYHQTVRTGNFRCNLEPMLVPKLGRVSYLQLMICH